MEISISYQTLQTPIGSMILGCGVDGICLLEFYEEDVESMLNTLQKTFKVQLIEQSNSILEQAKQELKEYFTGERKVFEVPLQLIGTDFQKQVWQALQTIAYGTTRTYMQQTLTFAKAESIRAVANANGKNPIAIIVPCHRVIGSNGSLTGYAGGLWRKKYLLDLEAKVKQGSMF